MPYAYLNIEGPNNRYYSDSPDYDEPEEGETVDQSGETGELPVSVEVKVGYQVKWTPNGLVLNGLPYHGDLDEFDVDYSEMTSEQFQEGLSEYVDGTSSSDIVFSIPGVYEIVSEHFNNEVLELLTKKVQEDPEI